MAAHDLLPLVPLVLALLVPATLFVAALLLSRRAPFVTASLVTLVTAGLSVLAVTLRGLFSVLGYGARGRVGSMVHDQIQLNVVSSVMLVLVSTLAIIVVRYSRTYLGGESG